MKLTIILLMALVAMTNASKPCICTDDYTPVCGEDGQTYGNECGMNCVRVKLAYRGTCGKATLITVKETPL